MTDPIYMYFVTKSSCLALVPQIQYCHFHTCNKTVLKLPLEYKISETILDAADSNMDFSERSQSPEYGFHRSKFKSQTRIFGQ